MDRTTFWSLAQHRSCRRGTRPTRELLLGFGVLAGLMRDGALSGRLDGSTPTGKQLGRRRRLPTTNKELSQMEASEYPVVATRGVAALTGTAKRIRRSLSCIAFMLMVACNAHPPSPA